MPSPRSVKPAAQARSPRRKAAGMSRRLSNKSKAAVGMKSNVYEAILKTVSAWAVQGIPG